MSRLYSVLIVVLSSVAVLTGCGGSKQSVRLDNEGKLDARELQYFNRTWHHVFRIDDTSFVAITEGRVTRFTSDGDSLWNATLPFDPTEAIDVGGVHIHAGRLYIASTRRLKDNYSEYRMHAIEIVSGAIAASLPLSKVNPGDWSGPAKELMHDVVRTEKVFRSISSVFSPDSSKLLAYKFYPVGTDRLGVEMMLYKPGYTLVTRSNVDFKFDAKQQQFLGVMTDNDGVAYLFIGSRDNRSFEVGRFEVLGGKRVRTIRFEFPTAQEKIFEQAAIAVASRGHAYLGMVRERSTSSELDLIDFDFYLNGAVKTVLDSTLTGDKIMLQDLYLFPSDDRLVFIAERHNDDAVEIKSYATDLSGAPMWSSSFEVEKDKAHWHSKVFRVVNGELDYWYRDGSIIGFRPQSLRTGEWIIRPGLSKLASISSETAFDFEGCMLDRRTLINRSLAFKLVLPRSPADR